MLTAAPAPAIMATPVELSSMWSVAVTALPCAVPTLCRTKSSLTMLIAAATVETAIIVAMVIMPMLTATQSGTLGTVGWPVSSMLLAIHFSPYVVGQIQRAYRKPNGSDGNRNGERRNAKGHQRQYGVETADGQAEAQLETVRPQIHKPGGFSFLPHTEPLFAAVDSDAPELTAAGTARLSCIQYNRYAAARAGGGSLRKKPEDRRFIIVAEASAPKAEVAALLNMPVNQGFDLLRCGFGIGGGAH